MKLILSPDGYQVDFIGKMSLACAILKIQFPEWVFVGFYRVTKPELLEIGPYQGNLIACGLIDFTRGVCGAAARNMETVIVDDVKNYPGYIACDSLTRSEIVVPVLSDGQLVAVLDIDSAEVGKFDKTDQRFLEEFVAILTG